MIFLRHIENFIDKNQKKFLPADKRSLFVYRFPSEKSNVSVSSS